MKVELGFGKESKSLIIPENYSFKKDLEYSVNRINESNIVNYNGYRLMIRILPEPKQ